MRVLMNVAEVEEERGNEDFGENVHSILLLHSIFEVLNLCLQDKDGS